MTSLIADASVPISAGEAGQMVVWGIVVLAGILIVHRWLTEVGAAISQEDLDDSWDEYLMQSPHRNTEKPSHLRLVKGDSEDFESRPFSLDAGYPPQGMVS